MAIEAGGGGSYAGGMFSYDAPTILVGCTFERNDTLGLGGGFLNEDSGVATIVIDCVFKDNNSGFGGGMLDFSGGLSTVINTEFTGNTASSDGGGTVALTNSSSTMVGCVFYDNQAHGAGTPGIPFGGGGIAVEFGSDLILKNCTLSGNTSTGTGPDNGGGGGIAMSGQTAGEPEGEQLFEVADVDIGIASAGFESPFVMAELEVTSGSAVRFVNNYANTDGSEACAEALYVDVLTLRSGSEITLDNCRVFYGTLIDEGATVNAPIGCGALSQVDCRVYGDVNGDTFADIDDTLITLACFGGDCVDCYDGTVDTCDISPCGGDGFSDVDDTLATLAAFGGDAWCGELCD